MKNRYLALGLMSGTSLDGLDVAAVEFTRHRDRWSFELLGAETRPYSPEWADRLAGAATLNAWDFSLLNAEYGRWLGRQAADFLEQSGLTGRVELICSHGHTVFHEPQRGFTRQIGSGAALAAGAGLPVVCDLRAADVALGGQGAPIVPIGERHLFPDHALFLNIGGIANISAHRDGAVTAYDVCPGNTPLNRLAGEAGFHFDEGGRLARSGVLLPDLFAQLERFPFYDLPAPRSLHTDVIAREFLPVVERYVARPADKLHTVTEHLAMVLGRHLNDLAGTAKSVLVTGGGAFNTYLMERLAHFSEVAVEVPDKAVVEFKEAMVMAFFGVLRLRGEVNSLASVTGAHRDSCGGAIYMP